MRLMITTLVAMTMCAGVAFAHGDATKTGETAKPAEMKAGETAPAHDMKKMAPAPEMENLKKMAGTWTVTEKHEPGPMMPKGGEGKGTAVVSMGPGGVAIMNYKSTGTMGKFEGMEVITWDPKATAYKSYWVDSMDPVGSLSMGKVEGDKIVYTGEHEMDGKVMSARRTVTHNSPTEWTMVMEGSMDGGTTWMKMMTVNGKKKGGKAGG